MTLHPDHHLMKRGGRWYVRVMISLPDGHRKRIKRSTKTKNLERARALRDLIIEHFQRSSSFGVQLRAQERYPSSSSRSSC